MASTTQVQISNLFNLMVQIDPRIEMYHFGFRSDILKNIDNNFDQNNTKGRQFPHLHFDVPEYTEFIETADYYGTQENVQISLYFDALQDYQNDGSANTKNLIEQWADLKSIAQDFIINFKTVFCDKYQAGYFSFPRFEQMAYGHNDRLITWKVSFILTHVIPCTEEGNKIDTSLLPDNIEETDLENWKSQGPSPGRCATILGMLSTDDLLNCILPTYDFADVATQNATTAQQQLDLTNWLCGSAPTPKSFLFDGVNEHIVSNQKPNLLFQGDDPASVGAWIKISAYDATYSPIIAWFYEPSQRGWNFWVNPGGRIVFSFKEGATSGSRYGYVASSVNSVPLNTWIHVSATKDANFAWTNAKAFINGIEDTDLTYGSVLNDMTPPMLNTLPMIGATGSTGAKFFQGNIFAPRIWTRELSQAEITAEAANKDYTSPNPVGLEWDADFSNSVRGYNLFAIPNTISISGNSQTQNMEESDLTTDIPV